VEFEIGSETIDYVKLAETEKLKPMEVELRKLEDLVRDILGNMEHLKDREEKMRNTNGKNQEPKRPADQHFSPLSHTECCIVHCPVFHDASDTTIDLPLLPCVLDQPIL
jgi:hypothetical protein